MKATVFREIDFSETALSKNEAYACLNKQFSISNRSYHELQHHGICFGFGVIFKIQNGGSVQ